MKTDNFNKSQRRNDHSSDSSIVVEHNGELLAYLIENVKSISKNKLKSYLTKRCIKVNGRVVTQYDCPVTPGMKITIGKEETNAFKSPYLRILYEDKWLIVIEKNIGILSMQTPHHEFCVKTLLDEYLRRNKAKCTVHLVHRLDRDTSGVMVYAKSIEIRQIFEANWRAIVKDRRYIAVVCGQMEQENGTVESWLKDNKFFYTYSSPTDNGGKYAITHYTTIQTNEQYSLVELKLETGRKNQIRVHMQLLNHPIVGDVKYGNESNPIGRLGLHAFRLQFEHPVTHELMNFETPYPTPFIKLMNSGSQQTLRPKKEL